MIIDQKPDFSKIPKSPGCYLYKDNYGVVIYVGKAKNLFNRIKSYFTNSENHSIKTKLLVSKIHEIDWIVVDSEVEALLLENNLIKKYYPKYNIDLKDNKRYSYIKITSENYPKIVSTRKVGKDGLYFGPYTDGLKRVQLMKAAVSIFKIRTCKTMPKKACLNFYIGLCSAPCIGNISKEEYNLTVNQAKNFLKGDVAPVRSRILSEMNDYSKKLMFEKALERKKQLEAIDNIFEEQKVERIERFDQDVVFAIKYNEQLIIELINIKKGIIVGKSNYRIDYSEDAFEEFIKRYYSNNLIPREIIINKEFVEENISVVEEYLSKLRNGKVEIIIPLKGEKKSLLELAEKNLMTNLEQNKTLIDLKNALGLKDYPKIIECFDISNLGTEHVVAGMSRFVDGRRDPAGFRKFKIKSLVNKQDDFAAIGEVVYRRYKKLKLEKSEFPNLIIIDGGPGQLSMALKSLKHLGLIIPIISIAKREEEIYLPNSKEPLRFDKNSKMMLLLREIRDNVHRYVLGYNRKRREITMREEFKKL